MKRETDQFVILASDGLWDVMTSEEAVDYVHAVMAAAVGSDSEREKWSGSGGSASIEGDGEEAGTGRGGRNAPRKWCFFFFLIFLFLLFVFCSFVDFVRPYFERERWSGRRGRMASVDGGGGGGWGRRGVWAGYAHAVFIFFSSFCCRCAIG